MMNETVSEISYAAQRDTVEIDPTTIPSLLAMCSGALESLEREIQTISAKCAEIARPESDSVNPRPNRPVANSDFGNQLVHLYERINEADQRLTNLRNRIDV